MLTKSQYAIGLLSAWIVWDEIHCVSLYKRLKKATALIETYEDVSVKAAEFMKEDDALTKYLLSLLNKHEVELDEFDLVALKALHVEVK